MTESNVTYPEPYDKLSPPFMDVKGELNLTVKNGDYIMMTWTDVKRDASKQQIKEVKLSHGKWGPDSYIYIIYVTLTNDNEYQASFKYVNGSIEFMKDESRIVYLPFGEEIGEGLPGAKKHCIFSKPKQEGGKKNNKRKTKKRKTNKRKTNKRKTKKKKYKKRKSRSQRRF